jgi:hypothetical protein
MGEERDRPSAETSQTSGKGVRVFDRAERWGRAKWLIALLVIIAVLLIVVALARGT